MPARAQVVLERDRHAGQRTRVLARARPRRRSRRRPRGASSASTRLKAWISASRASMRGEVLLDDAPRGRSPGPHRGRDARRRSSGASPEDRRDPEPAVLGRRAPRPAPRRGSRHRRGDVGAQHVRQRVRVRRRRHVVEVEGLDVGGVLEDRRQLGGERVELVAVSDRAGPGGPPWRRRPSRCDRTRAVILGGRASPPAGLTPSPASCTGWKSGVRFCRKLATPSLKSACGATPS